MLKLRLKGKTPEIRFSNAVILYDCICRWYKTFLETDEAGRMIRRFDQAFPCSGISVLQRSEKDRFYFVGKPVRGQENPCSFNFPCAGCNDTLGRLDDLRSYLQ